MQLIFNINFVSCYFAEFTPKDNFSLLLERGRVWEREIEGERDRERKRGRERHQHSREASIGCLLLSALTRNQTCKLGICPDRELNPWPFILYRPGLPLHFIVIFHFCSKMFMIFIYYVYSYYIYISLPSYSLSFSLFLPLFLPQLFCAILVCAK